MYSQEQKKLAIETFIKLDHSYADTIAELGYPTRAALRIWWNEYKRMSTRTVLVLILFGALAERRAESYT